MKKLIIVIFIANFSVVQYGQVVADHTVVEYYDDIPQQWIDSVKTMLVNIAGMSHGLGYINGVDLLENLDPKFQVLTFTSEPVPYDTDQFLRFGRPYMAGIASFYTSQSAIDIWKVVHLPFDRPDNLYDVQGFGWSYQSTWRNPPAGIRDPVYNVRWAGSTEGGADGDWIWGLDSGDSILTSNRVCMDTYLDAMEQYIQHCKDNNYPTVMLFTNGIVDGNSGTEAGFQRELKNQHIRNYIQGKDGYFFFDYADILIHNSSGEHYTVNWDDDGNLRPHDQIHPDNLMDYDDSWNLIPFADADGDHIGEVGALRLGKAMWWLLARIAGWDGSTGSDISPPSTPSSLSITSSTESSVSLSWDASTDNTGVSGYRVYRSGSLIETTAALNYTDNTVSACSDYTYTVSAIDAAVNESPQSSSVAANTDIEDPVGTITQPSCSESTGTIVLTVPVGSGIEYSIDAGVNWITGTSFSGLIANTTYTISVRNSTIDPTCVSTNNFFINEIPSPPSAPNVSNSSPTNICPSQTINLTELITSTTPTGGSVYYKTTNDPSGTDTPNPSAVGAGSYYIFYQNQDGCYSTGTEVVVSVNVCEFPDLTPTIIVTPNISHGITSFNVFVKITELNSISSNGNIVVNIPKDPRWDLDGPYNASLTILDSTPLNNSSWAYSSDVTNHIFTSSSSIAGGGYSTFGFSITFNPDISRGIYTITAQIESGGGGETRVTNNVDSEKLDYFQE